MIARRRLGALFAAPLLVAAAFAAACSQNADARPGAAANGSAAGKFNASEYVIGDPKAKVAVVEYLSVVCSHCAHFDKTNFPAIKKQYVDTGKVKWILREFLTPPEQAAAPGWVLARCAGRDKYFGVVEGLFNTQEQLFKTGDVRGWIMNVGKAAGLSEAQITRLPQRRPSLQGRGRSLPEGGQGRQDRRHAHLPGQRQRAQAG